MSRMKRHCGLALVTILIFAVSVYTQSPGTVTLHIADFVRGDDGTVTITLASGSQITVRSTDVTTPAPPEVLPTSASETKVRSGTATSQTPPLAVFDAKIREKCARDWPNDFTVRAFCEKQQKAALDTLLSRTMTSADEMTIRKKCIADWLDDYQVRNFCEEQQLKALRSLGR